LARKTAEVPLDSSRDTVYCIQGTCNIYDRNGRGGFAGPCLTLQENRKIYV